MALGYHTPKELLNVALCLAKKVIRLQEACPGHEIDDMAAHAQQIILEVEQRETRQPSESKGETKKTGWGITLLD